MNADWCGDELVPVVLGVVSMIACAFINAIVFATLEDPSDVTD